MIILDPAFTWAALIGCCNFAMITMMFWVMTTQHRNIRKLQNDILDTLLLAKTHAAQAASISGRTDDRLAGAVTEPLTVTFTAGAPPPLWATSWPL